MKSAVADVEAVLWLYLEALHEGDVGVLGRVFSPGSALHASTEGKATTIALDLWLERVRNRKSAKESGFESRNHVLSIEVEGSMAMAKVTSAFPPKKFVDYLSLVRTDEGWRIVAKTYHAEDIAAA